MARPRKVIAINKKHLTKAEKLSREISESELKAGADDLANIPEWLTPTGVEEYLRVITEAAAIGIWDNLDKSILALYADSYARYRTAADHLRDEGETYSKDGMIYPSPWLNIADRERKAVYQASARLGLAVSDRLRLQVPKAEGTKNKFFDYLPPDARRRLSNG